MLAGLGKPAIGDMWMGQTAEEHVSTSDAPRLMMGRGEWGQGTHKGARGDLTVPAPAVGLWTRPQASQSKGAGAPCRGASAFAVAIDER